MSALIRCLAVRLRPPMHCGMQMTWEPLRASYVCGSCGAAR